MSVALSSVAPAFLSQISGVFFPQNSLHCTKWDGSLYSSTCNCQNCSSLPEKPNYIWFSLLVHTQLRAWAALSKKFLAPWGRHHQLTGSLFIVLHTLPPGPTLKPLLEASCKLFLFCCVSVDSLCLGSTSKSGSVIEATWDWWLLPDTISAGSGSAGTGNVAAPN